MLGRKLIAATLMASLLTSSLAIAAPGPGPGHIAPFIKPIPKAAPLHRLGPGALEVLVGGVTLWMIGSTYYQWKEDQRVYVPVTVTPANTLTTTTTTTTTIDAGPYYDRLPDGANAVIINGTQYFNHNGEFYLPVQHNGKVAYIKVQF